MMITTKDFGYLVKKDRIKDVVILVALVVINRINTLE
jgi:hypothetical protein